MKIGIKEEIRELIEEVLNTNLMNEMTGRIRNMISSNFETLESRLVSLKMMNEEANLPQLELIADLAKEITEVKAFMKQNFTELTENLQEIKKNIQIPENFKKSIQKKLKDLTEISKIQETSIKDTQSLIEFESNRVLSNLKSLSEKENTTMLQVAAEAKSTAMSLKAEMGEIEIPKNKTKTALLPPSSLFKNLSKEISSLSNPTLPLEEKQRKESLLSTCANISSTVQDMFQIEHSSFPIEESKTPLTPQPKPRLVKKQKKKKKHILNRKRKYSNMKAEDSKIQCKTPNSVSHACQIEKRGCCSALVVKCEEEEDTGSKNREKKSAFDLLKNKNSSRDVFLRFSKQIKNTFQIFKKNKKQEVQSESTECSHILSEVCMEKKLNQQNLNNQENQDPQQPISQNSLDSTFSPDITSY